MSSPEPNENLVEAVLAVARAGGAEALRFFRQPLADDNKARPRDGEGPWYDPVTEGDRAAERVMRAQIEALFPDHGILGEELGERATEGPWRWILDPIDGTRGFLCGTPTWTTLVGLERDGIPIVGAIVQPFTGEAWHGFPGGAVHIGREGVTPCRVSTCVQLSAARLSTTDPRALPLGPMTSGEADRFGVLAGATKVARFGHDAYAYGLLALGHLDIVAETGLQRYDVSALYPVLRGAGATMTSWEGGVPFGGGQVLAAATPELHRAARAALGPQ